MVSVLDRNILLVGFTQKRLAVTERVWSKRQTTYKTIEATELGVPKTITRFATEHDPKPVPSISHSHKPCAQDPSDIIHQSSQCSTM